MSQIERDPRVRRQVEWLTTAGWTVDTVAPSEVRLPGVRDHFTVAPPPPPRFGRPGTLAFWTTLPHRAKFERLVLDRIPREVRRRVDGDEYGLVYFNDHHFLPWVEHDAFRSSTGRVHVHLDIHEYIALRARRDTLYRRLTGSYRDWMRAFIGHPRFDTRSTVVRGIADQYAREFGIDPLVVIRNAPARAELAPRPVAPDAVRLVYHGAGTMHRGLGELLEAMRRLDERFTLTLMLVGDERDLTEIHRAAAGLGDRVVFRDPVPMPDIARTINEFDLEVMFYPPRNRNLEFSLPNKFFEAVQGRLGVVIGESPMMRELVESYQLGLVVRGWTPADLAAGLDSLDADRIRAFKAAAHRAADDLHADAERETFLSQLPVPDEAGR